MAEKKHNDNWIFIAALVLSAVIFLFGLLLGNYIANSKMNEFKQTEERYVVDLVALETQASILNEDICKLSIGDLFEEKVTLGRMLTDLEMRIGKENEEVMAKKEIYELIEIKTVQYLEKIKQNCNQDFNIILFFYTNKKNDSKGDVAGCEDQGKILDQIVYEQEHNQTESKMYVFAFDMNSKNLATESLIEKYNITSVPSLVINGNVHDYMVKGEIESILEPAK